MVCAFMAKPYHIPLSYAIIYDAMYRRGVFRSESELEFAINQYIEMHNENPKPFIWTAKASDILEKVKRGRAALNKVHD